VVAVLALQTAVKAVAVALDLTVDSAFSPCQNLAPLKRSPLVEVVKEQVLIKTLLTGLIPRLAVMSQAMAAKAETMTTVNLLKAAHRLGEATEITQIQLLLRITETTLPFQFFLADMEPGSRDLPV
jgi:hypothetical protein